MNIVEKILIDSGVQLSAGTVIIKDNKALILQRGPTAPWCPNKWNLPGGKIDKGEDAKDAAIREAREEAGMDVSDTIKPFTVVKTLKYVFSVYVAEANRPDPIINWESANWHWVSKDELDMFDFCPHCRDIILEALEQNLNEALTLSAPSEKPKVLKALEEIKNICSVSPIDANDLLIPSNKALITVSYFDNSLWINHIQSLQKGGGSEALDFILSIADKHNVKCRLAAAPFGNKSLNKSKLTAWYKRHGFKVIRGDMMERLPRN